MDICLLSDAFLKPDQAFRLAYYVCHRRQTYSAGRYSHPGLPWYSPPISARSAHDPLGDYCHPSYNGRQAGVKSLWLTSLLPTH